MHVESRENRKSLNVSLSSRVGVGAGWWPQPSGYKQPLTLPQQRTRPSFRGTFVNGGPLEPVAGTVPSGRLLPLSIPKRINTRTRVALLSNLPFTFNHFRPYWLSSSG